MLTVSLVGGLAACHSAEKYKAPEKKKQADQSVEGTLQVTGTPAEMRWARDLAGALDAAKLQFSLQDTTSAIAVADSLVTVAETALDSLPVNHSLNKFLMVYVADAYDTLRRWYMARGDRTAADTISVHFRALAKRLQARRDSLHAQSP